MVEKYDPSLPLAPPVHTRTLLPCRLVDVAEQNLLISLEHPHLLFLLPHQSPDPCLL